MSIAEKILLESSLSRVWDHIEHYDVAIMTAFRGRNEFCLYDDNELEKGHVFTHEENLIRNRDLSATLLRLKYGVTDINGSYIEGYGDQNAREVSENSFFIVNLDHDTKFISNIISLGKQFCQDSVLIKPKGEDAYLYGTNIYKFPGLDKKFVIGQFKGGRSNEFFSKIRNRPFIFEHYDLLERMGKWAVTAISKKYIDNL